MPAKRSRWVPRWPRSRSEEHTSELQSLRHLVCRLLLEKKKVRLRLRRASRSVLRAGCCRVARCWYSRPSWCVCTFHFYFFDSYAGHRVLHSFPTRRSSDLEVTTDKVDAEVPAPASGKLLRILADAGQTITVGAPLAEIEIGRAHV